MHSRQATDRGRPAKLAVRLGAGILAGWYGCVRQRSRKLARRQQPLIATRETALYGPLSALSWGKW